MSKLPPIPKEASPLQGANIKLVPFDESWISEQYIAWLNSKDVTKFSNQRLVIHTKESCLAYLKNIHENGHFMWAIVLRKGNAPIHVGNVVAYVDHTNKTANLTILIGEHSLHSKGVGTDAFSCALEWLLNAGNLRKVYAGTMGINIGMLKVMDNCNMVIEARQKGHFLLNGEEVDLVLAAKFRA